MPDNVLITDYLRDLGRRLPSGVVAELADGVLETYQHRLADGLAADTAARTALVEFGRVEEIESEFALRSVGRKAARTVLITGPVVGACWGAALVASHVWTSPIPTAARVSLGTSLLFVIAVFPWRQPVAAATGGPASQPP